MIAPSCLLAVDLEINKMTASAVPYKAQAITNGSDEQRPTKMQ